MSEFADPGAVLTRAMRAWKPPPRLSLSEWADEYFVLSSETAAEPGRWRTLPYQVGIMEAITDPSVTAVSLMKSARIGYTLMLSATLGYHMHQDPTSILVAHPPVPGPANPTSLRGCACGRWHVPAGAEAITVFENGNHVEHRNSHPCYGVGADGKRAYYDMTRQPSVSERLAAIERVLADLVARLAP